MRRTDANAGFQYSVQGVAPVLYVELHAVSVVLMVARQYREGFRWDARLLLVVLLAAVIWWLFNRYQRQKIEHLSVAVRELSALNDRHRRLVSQPAPIQAVFRISAPTKSRFDRTDLNELMRGGLLEREQEFRGKVAGHLRAADAYAAYAAERQCLAARTLGRSATPGIRRAKFERVEARAFERMTLPPSIPLARVVASVTYRSPQGRNEYRRSLEWDFDQVRKGLIAAVEAKSRQTASHYMRERERSLMTHALRVEILRRDGFRCRFCGAAASDGVSLHVDHIDPISRGGRTVATNLQTLCQPCNLGKSNRFVG